MLRSLTIHCPEMGVTNTGYWWQTFTDRITDRLECRGEIEGICSLTIVFPQCKVYNIKPGEWRVEQVQATGKLDSGDYIQILYPPEQVLRKGNYLYAQEVDSIDYYPHSLVMSSCVIDENGKRYLVKSKLPLAQSRPVGIGLRKYIVEAVILPGTVDWSE